MMLNLMDFSSINTNYRGDFNNVTTDITVERKIMGNKRFIEDLRTLIRSRFDNNIEFLSSEVGVPVDMINNILDGKVDPQRGLIESIDKITNSRQEDIIQYGNKIEICGSGNTNNFEGGFIGTNNEENRELKIKVADQDRMLKEKDRMLDEKDQMLDEKDELIKTLKEMLEMLKNK